MLERPAPLAQAGAVRLAALVEARLGAVAAAQVAVGFGVVAFESRSIQPRVLVKTASN